MPSPASWNAKKEMVLLFRRTLAEQIYPAVSGVAVALVVWRAVELLLLNHLDMQLDAVNPTGTEPLASIGWAKVVWGAFASLLFMIGTVRHLDRQDRNRKNCPADWINIAEDSLQILAMVVAFGALGLIDTTPYRYGFAIFFISLVAFVVFIVVGTSLKTRFSANEGDVEAPTPVSMTVTRIGGAVVFALSAIFIGDEPYCGLGTGTDCAADPLLSFLALLAWVALGLYAYFASRDALEQQVRREQLENDKSKTADKQLKDLVVAVIKESITEDKEVRDLLARLKVKPEERAE